MNVRRRRFRQKTIKSPSLATIPEGSTLTLDSNSTPNENGLASSHYHPNRIIKARNNRRDDRLRIWFLILLPGYIITTSLIILRPLHRYDMQRSSRVGQALASFSSTKQEHTRIQNKKPRLRHHSMTIKRVVYLDGKHEFNTDSISWVTDESISPQTQDDNDDLHFQHFSTKDSDNCEPMATWQSMAFPTCNSLHELNIFDTSPYLAQVRTSREQNFIRNTYSAKLLGNGWFRDAWNVDGVHNTSFAIKTLRLQRDFLPEYFELHRRDAVALERLTQSPYVMDIYGFCGQSTMNELAFQNNQMNDLYRMATGPMMNNFSPYILKTKLQIASMTALAVAHVHSVPIDHVEGLDRQTKAPASIVHYDINPRNVVIMPSGKPKLNDFNVAEFLTWNQKLNATCGFEGRFHEPWWRSPEEMQKRLLDEKVDVYSLGNTLYVLLTGTEPRGKKNKKKRFMQVSRELADGLKPTFPPKYIDSDDPSVVAIRNAITLCWEPDPDRRPYAIDIANELYAALSKIVGESKA